MTRTVPVLAHTRRLPEKKETVAFIRKTEQLWDEVAGEECERALKEALEVDGGSFALHGGLV